RRPRRPGPPAGAHRAGRRAGLPGRGTAGTGRRCGVAGDVAAAHRRRLAADRRTRAGGNGTARRRADVAGHRGRTRCSRDRVDRPRFGDAADRDRRRARRRRLASGQLAGFEGACRARRRTRRARRHRRRRAVTLSSQLSTPVLAQAAQEPLNRAELLADDPWWLILLKAVVIMFIGPIFTVVLIVGERKIVGRMQNRPGPNRVGPFGMLQSLADAIKLPFKEQVIPDTADRKIYFLAPVVAVVPALIGLAAIPFGGEVTIFGERTVLQLIELP